MRTPTATEQLLLELVNRARADPAGEIGRLAREGAVAGALDAWGVDLDVVAADLARLGPTAPLAWNPALGASAAGRARLMVDHDDAGLAIEGGLDGSATTFGYTAWSALAESVFAGAESAEHAHAAHLIDWGPGGTWPPAANRHVMLSPAFAETGASLIEAPDRGVGPSLVVRHYGARDAAPAMLTGVVIDDVDADGFYDVGEGLGGVSVVAEGAAGRFEATTWDSGGYALALPDGDHAVTISGGALTGSFVSRVRIDGANVELDATAAMAEAPPVRLVARPDADRLDGTDGRDVLVHRGGDVAVEAGRGSDRVLTGWGHDHLRGGDGRDRIKSGAGDDVVEGGAGADVVIAGDGDDTVWGEAGDDLLRGGDGDDRLRAGAGADRVFGGRGHDALSGGTGDDLLRGDRGDDRLDGGAGADRLIGGAGADSFAFAYGFGRDHVLDFDAEADTLDFSDHGLVRGRDDLAIGAFAGGTMIETPEGGRAFLSGVDPDRLDADDFLF
ncbi:MAG: calcium-binding protein [Paracoccaceae bacterium]